MKNTHVFGLLLLLTMAPAVKAEGYVSHAKGFAVGLVSGAGVLGSATIMNKWAFDAMVAKFADAVTPDYYIKYVVAGIICAAIEAGVFVGSEITRDALVQKLDADADTAFGTHYISALSSLGLAYWKPNWTIPAALVNLKDLAANKYNSWGSLPAQE